MYTKKDCLELVEVLEYKRADLRNYLNEYSDENLRKIPAVGKWSAIMTAHHLYLTEFGSLAYCKKKLSFDTEIPVADEEVAKMESKTAYLIRSKKYKMEAPPVLNTDALDNDLKPKLLFDLWAKLRSEMKEFIEACDDDIFERSVYKHPLGGRLRIIGMLMFFDAHLDSHREQIEDNFKLMESD